MKLNNVTDTLTYVTGLGSGYAGISSIPGVTDPNAPGSLVAAIVAMVTLILQFLIMAISRRKEPVNYNSELLDLQRQVTELKSQSHVSINNRSEHHDEPVEFCGLEAFDTGTCKCGRILNADS